MLLFSVVKGAFLIGLSQICFSYDLEFLNKNREETYKTIIVLKIYKSYVETFKYSLTCSYCDEPAEDMTVYFPLF